MNNSLSMDFLQFSLNKSSDKSYFEVCSCEVSDLYLEGVIFSPNYDLLIYFIDSDLFKQYESFFFTVKIEIYLPNSKKIQSYNLSVCFSSKKYFSRFSGLFDDIKYGSYTVKILFTFNNANVLKGKQYSRKTFSKKINIVTLESIKADKIYCDNYVTPITNDQSVKDIFADYNLNKQYLYISFPGTKEIIGPFTIKEIKRSLISQYHTSVFLIPIRQSNLAFFVENNKYGSEFFGAFPLSDIQKLFGNDYKNFTVNDQPFNQDRKYPSGTIIKADIIM